MADAAGNARRRLVLVPERLFLPAVAGRRQDVRHAAGDAAQDATSRQTAPAQAALQVHLQTGNGGGGGQPLCVGVRARQGHAQRAGRRRHPAPLPRVRVRRRRLRQGRLHRRPLGVALRRATAQARRPAPRRAQRQVRAAARPVIRQLQNGLCVGLNRGCVFLIKVFLS